MATRLQSTIGNWVYRRFHRRYLINDHVLHGKNVLVVGSSASIENEALLIDLNDVDIVIKANYGVYAPLQFKNGWSARADILFTDLSGSVKSVYLAAGVKHVVARVPEPLLFHRFLKAKLRFKFNSPPGRVNFNLLPISHWDRLSQLLQGYSATTGFAAIDWVRGSEARKIGIVGFSFYRDRYRSGYLADYDPVATSQVHSPDVELETVRSWVQADPRFWLGSETRGFLGIDS